MTTTELGINNFAEYKRPISQTGLERQLSYLEGNWRREGLSQDWDSLVGIGFQINTQMNLLPQEVFSREKYDPLRKEILTDWLGKTEEDIKGFNIEYLDGRLVFPSYNQIRQTPDGPKIVASKYGDKELIDLVSEDERGGAVKRALKEKVVPFLLNSPDGALAVMTSPTGRSGLKNHYGDEIIFADSQTYIWQKQGEKIVGSTIKTDFSKKEHIELIKRLSLTELKEDVTEAEIVENIAGIIPIGREMRISDIVETMRRVRKDLKKSDLAYKDRTWDELYSDLRNQDLLWEMDDKTKEAVLDLKKYVLEKALTKDDARKALAATVLRIAKDRLKKQKFDLEDDESYGKILHQVRMIPGCAGGGENSWSLVNSITPRTGYAEGKKILCCTCPSCKQQVEAVIAGGKISCPSCNSSASYQENLVSVD